MDLIDGLVIKTIPYTDNTKIVYLLTDSGKKSFILKGATSLKSRAYQYSQELIHLSYSLSKNYFAGGRVNNVYPKIKADLKSLAYAQAILEFLDVLAPHVRDSHILYTFTLEILELIDNNFNPALIYLIYQLKCLYLFGIEPSFRNCSECGDDHNFSGFAIFQGGMVCKNCAKNEQSFVNEMIVNILKYLYYTKLDKIDFALFSDNQEISKAYFVVKTFYEHYLGFSSKTAKMLIIKGEETII